MNFIKGEYGLTEQLPPTEAGVVRVTRLVSSKGPSSSESFTDVSIGFEVEFMLVDAKSVLAVGGGCP